jgi:hypothetical protein
VGRVAIDRRLGRRIDLRLIRAEDLGMKKRRKTLRTPLEKKIRPVLGEMSPLALCLLFPTILLDHGLLLVMSLRQSHQLSLDLLGFSERSLPSGLEFVLSLDSGLFRSLNLLHPVGIRSRYLLDLGRRGRKDGGRTTRAPTATLHRGVLTNQTTESQHRCETHLYTYLRVRILENPNQIRPVFRIICSTTGIGVEAEREGALVGPRFLRFEMLGRSERTAANIEPAPGTSPCERPPPVLSFGNIPERVTSR